jgi:D-sedoheptulose 7-phosphate isomerase
MNQRIRDIQKELTDASDLINKAAQDTSLVESIQTLATKIILALQSGGKILFAGNGGSAAEAQHMAAEYVNRFRFNRGALAAISLTTDTSVLTSIANDFSFDTVFSRQIEAIGNEKDIFIGYTTSGTSKNILNAVDKAKSLGIFSVVFVGKTDKLGDEVFLVKPDLVIEAGTQITSHAQEVHLVIGHTLANIVERELFLDAVE